MKWLYLLLIVFVMSMSTSCSMFKKNQEGDGATDTVAETQGENAEGTDFMIDESGSSEEVATAPAEENPIVEGDVAKAEEKVLPAEGDKIEETFTDADVAGKVEETNILTSSGQNGSYTVQKDETLMMVAFKIYGDYRMWRKLAKMNPNINPNALSAGQEIKYDEPGSKFVWTPNGNPFLIRNGDTLGVISKDVYGVSKRWKEIYENNRPMILDPNLIFAGFTLYYVPDSAGAREPASVKN